MPYQSSESQAESKLATGGDRCHWCQNTKILHNTWRSPPGVQQAMERGRVRAGECQSNDPGGNTEHPRIHKEWDELLPECLSQLKTDGYAEQEEELSWTTNWLEKYTRTSVLHMDQKTKYADGRHHQICLRTVLWNFQFQLLSNQSDIVVVNKEHNFVKCPYS